jgi:predicted DCC family thiol-disulfide oxidoreductase YuxK
MDTNIVVVDGRAHLRLQAFAAAMGALGWPWRALAVAGWLPRPLADPLYALIARTRLVWGRRTCPLPSAALRNRLVE